MATALHTARLVIRPFSQQDFDCFAAEMLTDPRVVEFYYSFRDEVDMDRIRQQAKDDFRDQFEESPAKHKPGFQSEDRIEAYGSDQMCLYRLRPAGAAVH